MAKLEVLKYPDERLRNKALPVTEFNADVKNLVADMLETMYAEKGIGLAATQVNVHKQVVVMDHSDDQSEPMVFINPTFVESEEHFINEEGCLSVPGIYAKVERAAKVTIKAFDADGKEFEMEADELLAICIQHEVDHLNGVLFVDYLSPLKRQRIRQKLEKAARQAARAGAA
ncbi:peptide deformylase [Paraferrimonas sedimenticola]|uniref:Peptide deformylase n=1 Tax=Paraferrimonas sedimenticola TaxID=375674 RepID=A0AA37RYW0_9GAMM|nr:peptide deformylase [Paraferrimonas sedimenticola]GLP97696.1 peptide deformylase 1 [Paraferrimonas sedimenticola]